MVESSVLKQTFNLLSIVVQLLMVTTVPRQSVGSRMKIESVTDWTKVGVKRPIIAIINIAEVEVSNDYLSVILLRGSCSDRYLAVAVATFINKQRRTPTSLRPQDSACLS